MFKPRNYQKEGIEACLGILRSKKKSCREIVVAPTAGGKSWYTAETVRQLNEPIIIIQPNRELLLQNYEKYKNLGGKATICCASLKTKTLKGEDYTELEDGSLIKCREISKVTFCTVGTVIKYIEELKKLKIKKILVDECHLMTQSGTKDKKEKPAQIKKLLRLIKATNLCGLTATPIYLQPGMDGASLKMMNRVKWKLFTNIAHITQISQLVENNYWSKLTYQINETDESALEYNTSGSDYTIQSLKDYYKSNNLKNQIIEEIENLKREGRKSIMIFLNSIEEADELYKLIPNSAIVHSKIDLKTRAYFVKAFKELEIPVILNINCLATGFDHLKVDGLITARPTSSIAIYYQQIGRGVRIHSEKKDCKVVDFSGNVSKFGKVEELTFENLEYYGWGMFNGKGELLTDFPLTAKVRPTKKSLKESWEKEKRKESEIQKIREESKNPEFYFGMFNKRRLWDIAKSKDAKRLKNYCSWLVDSNKKGEFKFWGEKGEILKKGIYEYLKLEN